MAPDETDVIWRRSPVTDPANENEYGVIKLSDV